VAEVGARVLGSAPLGLFAAAYPATSDEYCGSCLELVGEGPLPRGALQASVGSSKIDCQLSYIHGTLSCRQQNSGEVFHRT